MHAFAIALCLVLASAAHAVDFDERRPARYPEGFALIGGAMWYAEMGANVISRWEGARSVRFAMPQGCGPTSVEGYGKGLLVLCHSSDELLLLSREAVLIYRQSEAGDGTALFNPNDAVRDDAGGVYFSSSGKFAYDAPVAGSLLYLDAAGHISRVADGLHYANGVEFDATGRRLLVSEHLARRILVYPVEAPGQLGPARVLQDLRDYLSPAHDWRAGPDGLHLGADGTLRVAIYARGEVLIIGPDGRLRRLKMPMRYTTTVLHDARRGLWVGGAFDINSPALHGEVVLMSPGPGSYGRLVNAH